MGSIRWGTDTVSIKLKERRGGIQLLRETIKGEVAERPTTLHKKIEWTDI